VPSALSSLLNPESLIANGGLALVALIVFAESGLLVGFMLPGDSLLFVTGFLTSKAGGNLLPSLWVVLPVVVIAAAAGDQVGYVFGRRVGPRLSSRPRTRLFHPERIERARLFFERHGARTILLARFVPIVRTFAPIVAGASHMPYRTFVAWNVVGALAWGAGVTTLGALIGDLAIVRDNLELAIVGIVALSLVPAAADIIRHRRARPVG
jgi:membrane-associated protein